MNMVSMKTEDGYETSAEPVSGLRLYLSDDQCEALGIGAALKAGQQIGIKAIAVVQSVTQDNDLDADGDGIDYSVCLEITDMSVGKALSASDAAARLYGS